MISLRNIAYLIDNHYISVAKQTNIDTLSMNKDRYIISEIRGFFAESDNTKAIQGVMNVMDHIQITQRQMGFAKAENCKFTAEQIFRLAVLFPFFSIKNARNYTKSMLGQLFMCHKDMFYRFLANVDINWRQILYSFTRRLVNRIASRSDSRKSTDPVCLIVDDTDFPKVGRKGELLGRVFSHVQHKSILGYKGLFLLRTDGMTQTFVDFTLQGEMGKKAAKPQGLTQKESEARFNKERDVDSRATKRMDEYFESKLDNTIRQVKRAILEGFRFDYLLVDSWFVCKELVNFVKTRHIGCNLLGMIKMSRTKYDTTEGAMTANTIIAKESNRKGHVKYSRRYHYYYCEVEAYFAGTPVKLFFYRNGKKAEWKALLSTNLALNAFEAYKIYSMRWSIEVAFHECKGLLNLGKCQCRDFASQIASISLCMLQYNILGYVKRYESYETIGGLFREITQSSVELTVTEKIWGILMEVIQTIAEAFNFDQDEMMRAIINNNNKELNAVRRAFEALQLAA